MLQEALVDGPKLEEVAVETQVYRAEAKIGETTFQQEAYIATVGETMYLDEGTRQALP